MGHKQNFYGELAGHGMDRPQAMVLTLENSRTVRIVTGGTPKPRLAVALDYLANDDKPQASTVKSP
jgi:hypothetical protein